MDYRRFHLPDFNAIPRRDYLLAIFSGILLAASFPLPGISPLAWVSLIPLLLTLHHRTARQSFSLGWVSGFVSYLGILYWLNIVMTTYGKLPLVISVLLYLFLAGYLGLYTGLAAWCMRQAEDRGISPAISLPLAWVAAEYVRAYALTGFPWATLGYSQYKILPIVQIADTVGVYGISFLIAMSNAVGLLIIRGFARRSFTGYPLRSAAVLAVLLFLTVWYGLEKLNAVDEGSVMRVALVQGNIPQDVKWDPAFQEATVKVYERLTREGALHGTDLVVWPESALPLYYQDDRLYGERLRALCRELETNLLFGSPAYERFKGTQRYLNSAFLIDENGNDKGRSDKIHLVPFGEYVPLAKLLPFVNKIVVGIGDFVPGRELKSLATTRGQFGVLICFEGIFPELARRYAVSGSRLLVNITNDAWFGRSSAPQQHLSMTVFRAIENRIPVVRSANTGISGIISSKGEIEQPTELFTEAIVRGEVRLGNGHMTRYTRFGDFFALSSLFAVGLFGVIEMFRNFRKQKDTSL